MVSENKPLYFPFSSSKLSLPAIEMWTVAIGRLLFQTIPGG